MSLTSRTTMWIWVVPLLGGEPPSMAMRLKPTSACSSRSSAFSNTNSTYLSPLLRLPKETLKYSFSGAML
uniref:Secreted protein n=1 Tax=Bubo bubo TaxID=30461 RepID=A0A8C0I966_BUBBB